MSKTRFQLETILTRLRHAGVLLGRGQGNRVAEVVWACRVGEDTRTPQGVPGILLWAEGLLLNWRSGGTDPQWSTGLASPPADAVESV